MPVFCSCAPGGIRRQGGGARKGPSRVLSAICSPAPTALLPGLPILTSILDAIVNSANGASQKLSSIVFEEANCIHPSAADKRDAQIRYERGGIFKANAEALVNAVNCAGVVPERTVSNAGEGVESLRAVLGMVEREGPDGEMRGHCQVPRSVEACVPDSLATLRCVRSNGHAEDDEGGDGCTQPARAGVLVH